MKHRFSHIKSEFKQRWIKADKTEARFLHTQPEMPRAQPKSSGRPSKPFNELSERSKRRKTETLRITWSHIKWLQSPFGQVCSYCIDTAKLDVSLYPWHPMTPTMHKILVHATIIDKALLPMGCSWKKPLRHGINISGPTSRISWEHFQGSSVTLILEIDNYSVLTHWILNETNPQKKNVAIHERSNDFDDCLPERDSDSELEKVSDEMR